MSCSAIGLLSPHHHCLCGPTILAAIQQTGNAKASSLMTFHSSQARQIDGGNHLTHTTVISVESTEQSRWIKHLTRNHSHYNSLSTGKMEGWKGNSHNYSHYNQLSEGKVDRWHAGP